MDSPMLRRVPDKHGNLQCNVAALDEVEGILTARHIVVMAPESVELRVDVPEFILAGETLPVVVNTTDGSRQALRITVSDETGRLIEPRSPKPTRGTSITTIDALAPGAYTIDVTGLGPGSPITPVSSDILVWA
jgi:hypothetical protein